MLETPGALAPGCLDKSLGVLAKRSRVVGEAMERLRELDEAIGHLSGEDVLPVLIQKTLSSYKEERACLEKELSATLGESPADIFMLASLQGTKLEVTLPVKYGNPTMLGGHLLDYVQEHLCALGTISVGESNSYTALEVDGVNPTEIQEVLNEISTSLPQEMETAKLGLRIRETRCYPLTEPGEVEERVPERERREARIREYIIEHDSITPKELAKQEGIGMNVAYGILSQLAAVGALVRVERGVYTLPEAEGKERGVAPVESKKTRASWTERLVRVRRYIEEHDFITPQKLAEMEGLASHSAYYYLSCAALLGELVRVKRGFYTLPNLEDRVEIPPTGRELRVIDYIEHHGSITSKILVEMESISGSAANNYLTRLANKGRVVKVEKGVYTLTEPNISD